MKFDKNQREFPSNFHREIWWWAVGIVPVDISLTDNVKNQCSENVLDGCYQWYDYFNELCSDMYNNTGKYAPASPRQYRDILENITAGGLIQNDSIVWDKNDWIKYCEKFNKSKSSVNSGITIEYCLIALKRIGLECNCNNGLIVFYNTMYPKIFHAMKVFESSPNVKKTPVRHHFAHCEFRQLFKSYSPNYDELLRAVSDESLYIAKIIHDFAKSMKIQRYVHFDTIKYKYKNIRVMDFSITGSEYPTLRVNIGTCANPQTEIGTDDYYTNLLKAPDIIQEMFVVNLEKCDNQDHYHQSLFVNEKNINVCPYSKLKINPFKKDINTLLYFISARKESIDKYTK